MFLHFQKKCSRHATSTKPTIRPVFKVCWPIINKSIKIPMVLLFSPVYMLANHALVQLQFQKTCSQHATSSTSVSSPTSFLSMPRHPLSFCYLLSCLHCLYWQLLHFCPNLCSHFSICQFSGSHFVPKHECKTAFVHTFICLLAIAVRNVHYNFIYLFIANYIPSAL